MNQTQTKGIMCVLDLFYLGNSGSDLVERGGHLAVVVLRALSLVKVSMPNMATYL